MIMVSLENLGRSPPAEKHIRIVLKGSRISSHPQVRGVRRTTDLGHAVNQSAEVQSALEFFATAHLFREGYQPYKNEVYLCRQSSMRLHSAHTGSILPTKLWGKSSCEVAESVIRRPQITISWTSSESKCRDAVCVGVLRNSTFIP